MPKIQCKMCGGMVELAGKTVAECPYCGSITTFPKLDSARREQLYAQAEHFRQLNDFDRALAVYETILKEDGTDAEAYWGVVLCRYGIEYVEDPVSHKRVPTCNRLQLESVLADADYLSALENADSYERDIYEQEGKRIAELQKSILAISSKEEPYDVFICYKEKTEGGTRTKDSALAQDIYYQLTNEGYKVFFSRITLEDKLGMNYEPYIFAALNSSKVMLVVGTCREHFEAVWVKNEWKRFLALMKADSSRLLIPCFQGMDPYDLPEELSMLQSQDMSKIAFMQDLVHGVKKALASETKKKEAQTAGGAPSIDNLMKRIRLFLKTQDYKSAQRYCERVLDLDAENAEAYLYKLLAEMGVESEDKLLKCNGFAETSSFKLAMEFGDEEMKRRLQGYVERQKKDYRYDLYVEALKKNTSIEWKILLYKGFSSLAGYKDSNRIKDEIYQYLLDYYSTLSQKLQNKTIMVFMDYLEMADHFMTLVELYEDAKEKAVQSIAEAFSFPNQTLQGLLQKGAAPSEVLVTLKSQFKRITEHPQCSAEICGQCKKALNVISLFERYLSAKRLMNEFQFKKAILQFGALGEFLDSRQMLQECRREDAKLQRQAPMACLFAVFVFIVVLALVGYIIHRVWLEKQKAMVRRIALQVDSSKMFAEIAEAPTLAKDAFLKAESVLAEAEGLFKGKRLEEAKERYQQALDSFGKAEIEAKRAKTRKEFVSVLKQIRTNMIPVKCGTFTMWEHRVTLTEDFWLGKYEVTQNEYSSIMEQNPSNFWTSYNLPVENVTWDEAMAFCRKLTELERKNGILKKGYVYSLPTEAQWEYVWKSSANSTDSDSGWCANNSDNKTHEVGLKKANGWGFHDMNGNVREWCRDWYYKPIYMTDMTDPTGPVEGTFHVVRGTSFSDGMVEEPRRYYGSWGDARVGFRIALVPEKQAQ